MFENKTNSFSFQSHKGSTSIEYLIAPNYIEIIISSMEYFSRIRDIHK